MTDKETALVSKTKKTIKTVTKVEDTIKPSKDKIASTAKSGKRSKKALEVAEIKQHKDDVKKNKDLAPTTSNINGAKLQPKPTRSKLERRSKAYQSKVGLISKDKKYTLNEACKVIASTSSVSFDATVELHIRLDVDPRQADQNVRDNVLLPAGTGKKIKIAAFVSNDDEKLAKDAGADIVGEAEITKIIEAGNLNFDILISTPSQMPKLGKYARVLGPRGLMPNPKSGTVTSDIVKAINEAKSGKIEYRVDNGGNIHVPVGKVSFTPSQLEQNLNAIISSIQNNKPSSIKNAYIISSFLATSMGPSIRLSL